MKTQPASAHGQKANGHRKPPAAGNGDAKPRNGAAARNGGAHVKETLPPQPPISAILNAPRMEDRAGLDKSELLSALLALKKGVFSARLPSHLDGLDGKIADAFNDVVEL